MKLATKLRKKAFFNKYASVKNVIIIVKVPILYFITHNLTF